MIQSVDRAIRVLTALQGARRMSLSELAARLGCRRRPCTASSAPWSPTGWSCRSAARAATSSGRPCCGSATSTSTPSSCGRRRSRGPRTSPGAPGSPCAPVSCSRRRRDHPPRAAPRRQPADARGRHRDPGHASALGKAILAFLARRRPRVLGAAMRSMTGETLTSPDELRGPAGRGAVQRRHGVEQVGRQSVKAPSRAPSSTPRGQRVGAIGVSDPTRADLTRRRPRRRPLAGTPLPRSSARVLAPARAANGADPARSRTWTPGDPSPSFAIWRRQRIADPAHRLRAGLAITCTASPPPRTRRCSPRTHRDKATFPSRCSGGGRRPALP